MDVEVGSAADLDAFVELLEEAGAWLMARGLPQWPPGTSRAARASFEERRRDGALLVARARDGLAGGCLVHTTTPDVWTPAPEAAYLERLVVGRPWAGAGLGAQLIDAAEAWARERGLTRLRLDCWAGNDVLRATYRELGFAEVGVAPEEDYEVQLMERR